MKSLRRGSLLGSTGLNTMSDRKSKRMRTYVAIAVLATLTTLLAQGKVGAQEESALTAGSEGRRAHIFPTVSKAAELADIGTSGPALAFHGGPVMTKAYAYAIFWVPSKLQNGGSTSMSKWYQTVQNGFLYAYPGHGIDNNNTQYYSQTQIPQPFPLPPLTLTSYIANAGGLAGTYVDTSPYPASGCVDPATPGNCITDAQIQAEIQKVMTSQKWTGGLNNIFLLFTSSGEGSENPYGDLAYVQMCAYHSYFFSGKAPIIYADIPYGNTSVCQAPGTPSPNRDPVADTALTAVSHELTEAITDPELNAWYTSWGSEIGDLCAYNYGTNTWDSDQANQSWPTIELSQFGVVIGGGIQFFELQEEYDNHAGGCVQIGP